MRSRGWNQHNEDSEYNIGQFELILLTNCHSVTDLQNTHVQKTSLDLNEIQTLFEDALSIRVEIFTHSTD